MFIALHCQGKEAILLAQMWLPTTLVLTFCEINTTPQGHEDDQEV